MPRTKKMKHFNHPHELYLIEVRREHLNSICFGCKLALSGSCYTCSQCTNFFLHKSCSEVPQALQHKAHPQHTLGLLFSPLCSGTCNACGKACNSFTYNCTFCNFNLHVDCASQLENESPNDYGKQESLKDTKSKLESLSSQMRMLQQEEEKRCMQEREMMEKEEINLQRQRLRMYQQQMNFAEESMKRMGQL